MAIYRVWSGGNGTGGANNTNWSQAYATLAAAIAVPPAAGDRIYISHVTQENIGADTTWTLPASVDLISVDKDSSETPTAMGTGGWIGTSSGAFQSLLYAGKYSYIYGVTVRNGGTAADPIALGANATAIQALFEDCYAWLGTTNSGQFIRLGGSASDTSTSIEYRNLTVRFSNAGQGISSKDTYVWSGGSVSSDGTAPTTLFNLVTSRPGSARFDISGVDLSFVTGTLVSGGFTLQNAEFRFSQCKLSSSVTPLSSVTNATKAGPKVWYIDCVDNAGTPARGIWGYYDGLGSLTKDTGIYRTDGSTGWAWKVVGAAAACYETPFVTPWVEFNNTVNTSITPRFEIFRDGSTTAYTDAQVWGEWARKDTSGSDQAKFSFGDRQAFTAFLAGTAGSSQATGSGTGDWATGSGSDWSGKVDSGSAITCAEDGVLRGRVAVVGAITVYIDPQIRT